METELKHEVEEFINVISEFETRRNRNLRSKIEFLKKYLGTCHEEHIGHCQREKNPNPFFITKEKLDA